MSLHLSAVQISPSTAPTSHDSAHLLEELHRQGSKMFGSQSYSETWTPKQSILPDRNDFTLSDSSSGGWHFKCTSLHWVTKVKLPCLFPWLKTRTQCSGGFAQILCSRPAGGAVTTWTLQREPHRRNSPVSLLLP